MKNKKSILLLLVITFLMGASLYLVSIIQDGSSPLAIFNTRASGENEALDVLLGQLEGNTTPTIPYKSTSPTLIPTNPPGGSTSPEATLTATIVPTLPITPTTKPQVTIAPTVTPIVEYVTPTPITSLPVAGFEDHIQSYLLGGGLLILVAMLL